MGAPGTPGPWEVEPGVGKGAWIKGSTGEWSALACGDSDESARANARLIAAAPALFDALEKCRNALNEYASILVNGEPQIEEIAIIDECDAALKLAIGESHE